MDRDIAFEMATSNICYGPGVTREIGKDLKVMDVQRAMVFIDANLAKKHTMIMGATGEWRALYITLPRLPSTACFVSAVLGRDRSRVRRKVRREYVDWLLRAA